MPRRMFPVARDPLGAQKFRVQRPESPEDLWQPLYDRVNVTTTVPSQVSFFSVARGQSANLITGTLATSTPASSKTKSYRDTNMENSNVVPTKLFKFVGISIGIVHAIRNASTNALDRNLTLDGGYLRFRIIDKDILFLPLLNLPLINPFAGVATTANATTINADNPGGGQGVPMYRLPINITLNPYENFTVTFDFDGAVTLTETLDLYCILQGFQRRPT